MKKKKKILSIAFLMTLGALSVNVMAQDQAQDQDHDHAKMDMDHEMPEAKSYDVDTTFQKQLNTVFQANLKLNVAFMTDRIDEVVKAAENTSKAIGAVDMMLVKDQAHMDWMSYRKTMNGALEMIIAATSVEKQRLHFADFNSGLYQSIKAFSSGEEVFYQYCPMAIDNEGAYWLSSTKEIQNPYMGSAFPSCGSVKETLN